MGHSVQTEPWGRAVEERKWVGGVQGGGGGGAVTGRQAGRERNRE